MNNNNQINYNQINNPNQNINSNNVKQDNDSKKILSLIVMIAVLMVTTTGATYAYFAISASNNNVLIGNAATASISLTVQEADLGGTKSGATKTNVMVPQLSTTGSATSALSAAIGSNYKCVDANGNTVCKVYTITITNNSSAAVRLNGTIQFLAPKDGTAGANTYTNLSWRKITSTTSLGTGTDIKITNASNGAIVSNNTANDCSTTGSHCSKIYDIPAADGTTCDVTNNSTGCTRISLAAGGGSTTYYIVVWINETVTTAQNTTDKGEWVGIISFQGENGTGITSTITSSSS